jgi:hypothetical protein
MKKTIRRRITNLESQMHRGLRLSQETIRSLTSGELANAVAGCDTTSVTTERAKSIGC